MGLTGLQRAGLAAAVLAGLGLGAALLSESWLHMVPCALCLLERWPYRVAILLGVISVVTPRLAPVLVGAVALTMLASAGLGLTHVGVEQGWWPSPLPECAAPQLGGGTMAERLARMPARPAKPCDEPTFLVPGVPVSMAAMNLIVSLAVSIGLGATLLRARRMA